MTVICYKCNHEVSYAVEGQRLSRSDDCPHCQTSLRCCKMCLFYDPHSYNECKEPVAQRIIEKENANFCDYFKVGMAEKQLDTKDKLLEEANKLFKF